MGGEEQRPRTGAGAAVTGMTGDTVTDQLEQLSSGRVDAAWSGFLARYSPLIMQVIRRHDHDYERATECFDHVCAALSDDGFRRLRAFRPDGPARFKTWLMAVVANLCVDWRRKQQGRVRPIPSVSNLTELDQQVFHCIYVRHMSRAQCVEALIPRYPGLTDATVSGINARLFALLTPQQRWHLSARASASRPGARRPGPGDDEIARQVAEPGPGPDDLAAELQEQRRLKDALALLPAEQRLLLRLRYEQNLTLAEVARLTNQPDPFRANRQIHAALEALAEHMGDAQVEHLRKTR